MSGIVLYDFQKRAVLMAEDKPGFLNADDMGLGKTVMAVEGLRRHLTADGQIKVLVVTVLSAIGVWEEHIKKMLPEGVGIITPRRNLTDEELSRLRSRSESTVCIVNWAQVRLNADLGRLTWTDVIADEAAALCNRKTAQTKALKKIRARRRLALTGTPVLNSPADLWGILSWLYPHRYTSYWKFFEQYCMYVEKWHAHGKYKEVVGVKNVHRLRSEIRPFVIRRKKETVFPELPEKYRTVIEIDLDPAQRRAYEQMKKEALAWVGQLEDEALPAPVALSRLTRLRQFAVAHASVKDVDCSKCKGSGNKDGERCPKCKGLGTNMKVTLMEPSSKLDAVMEILESTDQSVVVFSQFAQTINLLEYRLAKKKIPYSRLTGDITGSLRAGAIETFQSGETRVFIATIKAGGSGITLTKASTVVFIDRSWSYADNLQAEDRLHRHGQQNAVQVIDIVARDTVDAYVEERLQWKRSVIRKMLGDE